jgi:hypothetical protein
MPKKRRNGLKPPWVWARVVKACTALMSTEKLVWLEHYALLPVDRDGGATISAIGMSARLGLARVTVERARQDFTCWGLLTRRGPDVRPEWFPQLPGHCRPKVKALSDDDVVRLADLLAQHIKRVGRRSRAERRWGAQEPLTDEGGNPGEDADDSWPEAP